MTTIGLGGPTGLDPVTAPSAPLPVLLAPSMIDILNTTHKMDDPKATELFSLDGCIAKIIDNIATIENYSVLIDSSTPGMKNVGVGDCLHMDGNLQSIDGKVIVIPVKVNHSVTVVGNGKNQDHVNGDGKGNNNHGKNDDGKGKGNSNGNSNGH